MDSLPQKICESCIQTLNAMIAFRNKCKRSNDELHKMIGLVEKTRNVMEIVDETKDNSEEDQKEFSFEPDKIFKVEPDFENDQKPFVDEFEVKPWRPQKIACHLCGKLYITHEMKFHLNEHNGIIG